jgi:hypothetical protein
MLEFFLNLIYAKSLFLGVENFDSKLWPKLCSKFLNYIIKLIFIRYLLA